MKSDLEQGKELIVGDWPAKQSTAECSYNVMCVARLTFKTLVIHELATTGTVLSTWAAILLVTSYHMTAFVAIITNISMLSMCASKAS